jgi:predicted LPLAT superfamily acyltransferase
MAEWRAIPEAGTVLGIRVLVLLARTFGRRIAGWLLYLVALYYAAVRGLARRASRDYLRRVGLRASFGNVVRHLHTFAQVSLDRLFFLTGKWGAFRVEQRNHDQLVEAARSGRGVLLLGAHLGSFEVMRCRAREVGVPINVVVDYTNAARINRVFHSLAPDFQAHMISLADDSLAAMLAIRAAIDRGELVAILGDRRPATAGSGSGSGSGASRQVVSPFLGADAAFPAGPWLLAHALGCPVYFVAGVFTPPNQYALHFELLAERVQLDRRERDAALARYVRAYAAMLETYTRAAPMNWFNFYDFWSPS